VVLAANQAVFFVVSVLLFFFGLRLLPGDAEGTFGIVGLGIAEGAALCSVLLLWRYLDRRPITQLGLSPQQAWPRWLKGALVAALMMGFVVMVWYTLLDGASWAVNPDPVRAAIALLAGLLGFLIQGPAEEVLFRGYVYENVHARWGLGWGVAVSSLTFALMHAHNPAFGPLPFVNLLLFGVATALYKTNLDGGQLWGVFGIHTVWNWLQQVVFGLPNSGITSISDNALFTVTPNTAVPDVIWGGGFGPEGTLATTFVLVALIGLTLRQRRPVPVRAHVGEPAKTAQS
jgi:membrane protease YdiL (CAAX protease family)